MMVGGKYAPNISLYTNNDVIHMIEFKVDNNSVEFVGPVIKRTFDLPMSTICDPLLVDVFLYSYEVEFNSTIRKQNTQIQLGVLISHSDS